MYENLIAAGLIGTDEAGKGDFVGPLVCAACYLDSKNYESLSEAGVRDSKKISNNRVVKIADTIKRLCPHDIIVIGPEKYNQLYSKIKNLNRLLAWAHARAIENLLNKVKCQNVITDKFGDEKLVLNALQDKGKKIDLIQRNRAESNPAVAAASVLARAEFLKRFSRLSESFDVKLHLGAGPKTDQTVNNFIRKHGREKLPLIAKMHFKNVKKVIQ